MFDPDKRAERQYRRRLKKELKRECKYYAKVMQSSLAQQRFDHWLRMADRPTMAESILTGKASRQVVQFIRAEASETAVWLWVDTRNLPYGVSAWKLKADETIYNLTRACGRKVDVFDNPSSGFWYRILRDGAVSGIPGHFSFQKAIKHIPKTAGALAFIVGLGENQTLVKRELQDCPHLLVAGATGTGKSVFLNSVLCTLLLRNSVDDLQLLLIDLKGGTELSYYEKVPHLWREIVTKESEVIPALEDFEKEMQRRQKLFKGRVRDIAGWNKTQPGARLPALVLVFDELSQVLLNPDRKMAREAEKILGKVMAVSRATGGYIILCTQRPSSDVVTGYIKANAPVRMAFSVATQADSRVIIDNSDARGLSPAGRGILVWRDKRLQIQAPFMSESAVRAAIRLVIERNTEPQPTVIVTHEELYETALENFGGKLHQRAMFQAFKERVSSDQLKALLATHDDQIVEVKGQRYRVTVGAGPIGRYLEPVENDNGGGMRDAIGQEKDSEVA